MSLGGGILALFIIGIVAVALIIYIIVIFNGLIRLKNNIKKAWANIDVLLKQRTSEIPNLIAAVKGYMKHEKGTIESLTKARAALMGATTMPATAKYDNLISETLKSVFAVAENYPTLKANENFLKLQERITGIENELADRREFFNDSVNIYNIRIQSIPDMFIAKLFKYQPEEMFKIDDEDKKNVNVGI